MGEKDFLVINGLYKSYGEGESKQEVLKDLNVSVSKGEFCVLLGPSGSEKSTLLNIIGGIDGADDGYVSINGDKLKDMDDKTLTLCRRKHSLKISVTSFDACSDGFFLYCFDLTF